MRTTERQENGTMAQKLSCHEVLVKKVRPTSKTFDKKISASLKKLRGFRIGLLGIGLSALKKSPNDCRSARLLGAVGRSRQVVVVYVALHPSGPMV